MDKSLKFKIKQSLKTAIKNFFKNQKPESFHVLNYIFPRERRIRSLIGGLETSMGTTVWEPIARTLAESNKYEQLQVIAPKLLMPAPFPKKLQNELNKLIHERQARFLSTEECINRLKEAALKANINNLQYINPPSGTGVDIYFLSNKGIEYAFDIKTSQSNKGDFKKFNTQLLEWYAYRFSKNPDVNFKARIAIPFNPFNKDWYVQQKLKISPPLDQTKDIWVEDEFWDFCSGDSNTWESIKQVFIELGEENFGGEFQKLFE